MKDRWGHGPIKTGEEERQRKRESECITRRSAEGRQRLGLPGRHVFFYLLLCLSSPACLFIWLRPTNFEVFFSSKFLNIFKNTFKSKNKYDV
ncbi:hypothetical protein NC651_002450 [Populus alba x Populus x berolinensis]|nr:hypothetical protein NC651_002450 [Populus alba x Populus x berolinensis]